MDVQQGERFRILSSIVLSDVNCACQRFVPDSTRAFSSKVCGPQKEIWTFISKQSRKKTMCCCIGVTSGPTFVGPKKPKGRDTGEARIKYSHTCLGTGAQRNAANIITK